MTRAFTIRTAVTMAVTCRAAVASFIAVTGLAFVVDFFEGLLPIKDFFVIAIVDSFQDPICFEWWKTSVSASSEGPEA